MKSFLTLLEGSVKEAFEKAGYDAELGSVSKSNRPDLCEFQCNGAMRGAKLYHKAPLMIAEDVCAVLARDARFELAEAVKPGFINLKVSPEFLTDYVNDMMKDTRFGLEPDPEKKKIMIDYGGPNVAKPLHVGHLRSAVIGESIKRILRYMGNDVLGDIHMGDWGLQMGLIITELKHRQPDLPYFEEGFEGPYPEEAPFTISELEEIYPCASARSKEDQAYYEEAMEATRLLQEKQPGYYALWQKIMQVSVADLKKNYEKLDVSFDLWKGESDVEDYIPDMVEYLKNEGFAYYDEGALLVDVSEESDAKEVPPCMILKSNGSALYDTTDLATLIERREKYDPDRVIYVVDQRQALHFVQVFRCAKKTGLVRPETELIFQGFGTMNGKDGKPFKTRAGGVMRLEDLIGEINGEMLRKIRESGSVEEELQEETAQTVGLAALKYGDLSNQASKDYIFDVDRFTSFEGNTGPYILYTIVRLKSLLEKYGKEAETILPCVSASEKELLLSLTGYHGALSEAYRSIAPHVLCAYIYELANACNRFYHEHKILTEPDEERKASWIAMITVTKNILEQCIALLGFSAPEHM